MTGLILSYSSSHHATGFLYLDGSMYFFSGVLSFKHFIIVSVKVSYFVFASEFTNSGDKKVENFEFNLSVKESQLVRLVLILKKFF